MSEIEHASASESEVRALRRQLIQGGACVSLIGYDGARGLYVFDEYPGCSTSTP